MTHTIGKALEIAAILALGTGAWSGISPGEARAGSVADCVTLLNQVGSAASGVKHWRGYDGIKIAAVGDNSRVTGRVTRELKSVRSAYDKAMACANSKEARSSRAYATARSRFARDFPKYQKAIQEAGKVAAIFNAALEIDNDMKRLVRRLQKADPAGYDREHQHATKTMAQAFKLKNEFLTQQWSKGVKSAVHDRLRSLEKRKRVLDTKVARETLVANSVTKRLSSFSIDDAMDPRKVTKAFEQSSKEMYVALPTGEAALFHRYAPVNAAHENESRSDYPGNVKPKTRAFVFYNQKGITVRYQRDILRMKSPIPGLVWHVSSKGVVVFVSASGGRYQTHIKHIVLAKEAMPLSNALVNGMLLHDDVVELSRRGAINARYGPDMKKSKEAYGKCADKVWTANQKAFSRLRKANILRDARRARLADLDAKVRRSIDRKCKSHQRKYSTAWDRAVAEYNKLRLQTMQATKSVLSQQQK